MADAHVSEIIVTDTEESAPVSETIVTDAEDLQSKIKSTMHSRVDYYKNQADSLTFEGVRRLLEKDLEMEMYALDVHKSFIKQCLLECMDGADNDTASKNSGETLESNVCLIKTETESPEDPSPKKHVKESSFKDEGQKEDSPVLGLMTGRKTTQAKTEETNGNQNQEVISESMIKKAIRKREGYIRANSETVTMSGIRRFLEEDLELDKHTLDPYKKFIIEEIDEVMKSPDVSETRVKKNMKKNLHSKPSKDDSSEESSNSSSGEELEDEVKMKKIISSKGKTKMSKGLKKRKRPEKETNKSSKKRIKKPDTAAEVISDAEKVSEGSDSQSSAEKPVQKKVVPTPAPGYGKRVENLRSVIKSCGMRISPAVYTKAKRAPENEREACLIKELEEMLSREGLSKNPSEKEIKDCRKRKNTIKEPEGIDMSNIVASSRRRSTTSFVPPPKPKLTVDSDEDESEESEDDINSDDENSDDDVDDDENNDDGVDDDENNDDDGDNNGDDGDANDGSESEEVEKVDDEGSD